MTARRRMKGSLCDAFLGSSCFQISRRFKEEDLLTSRTRLPSEQFDFQLVSV